MPAVLIPEPTHRAGRHRLIVRAAHNLAGSPARMRIQEPMHAPFAVLPHVRRIDKSHLAGRKLPQMFSSEEPVIIRKAGPLAADSPPPRTSPHRHSSSPHTGKIQPSKIVITRPAVICDETVTFDRRVSRGFSSSAFERGYGIITPEINPPLEIPD